MFVKGGPLLMLLCFFFVVLNFPSLCIEVYLNVVCQKYCLCQEIPIQPTNPGFTFVANIFEILLLFAVISSPNAYVSYLLNTYQCVALLMLHSEKYTCTNHHYFVFFFNYGHQMLVTSPTNDLENR